MRQLRALDLFSGAGGATRGLQLAGFHVTGVDIKPQPRYVGDAFIQGDALTVDLDGYDFIWASPPCQAYSALRARWPDREYVDLVAATRARLVAAGVPYAIENVPGAPLLHHITLCGTMFGLRVYRHRWFETSFLLMQPHHPPHLVSTGSGHGQTQRKAHFLAGGFVTVTGNVGTYCGPEGMGIDWMNGDQLSQAIPPAYSEWLGEQAVRALSAARVA